jgi:outer membrane receptor protein involved in Fe transport
MAVPAMAQIEEVVVTAQKKSEDVQNVPIAVTAFTGQDLKDQQINQFKDLQFHAPNVTYTSGQYGSADFQIRGIGVTATGYDSESGVAVNFDEVYLGAPQLTEGSFYDLSGVEVLAGPQSTLYGRGATGGAVNINIAKPDLENASVQLIGDYGNYDATKVQGVVNIPIITDELALRVAGEWNKRDGYVTNIYDNSKIDSLDEYSVRTTLRWQPSQRTTIDFTGEFSREDDSHMRGNKQLCTTDPTGVLGCLPGSAGTQPINVLSNASTIASSQQGLNNAFAGTPLAGLGTFLGLYNLTATQTLPAGFVDPSSARQVNTDYKPVWRSQDNFLSLKWQQNLTPWLDSTMIGGYDVNSYLTKESYNNIPGIPFPTNNAPGIIPAGPLAGFPVSCGAAALGAPNLNCAENVFLGTLAAEVSPAYAANYGKYFAVPGALPISGIGGFGLTGNNFSYIGANEGIDQDNENFSQYSGEWRLATSFSGPLNAMLGVYYLHTKDVGDYYVTAPTLDYPGIILGGLLGPSLNPAGCVATGCIYSPGYYHNEGQYAELNSKSVFGEVYYQAIPDLLKFTAGLRLTDDEKAQSDRIAFLNGGLVPIGTTSEATGIPAAVLPYDTTKQDFTKFTGRFVTDFTPKLDFTDSTLIYASYARGYKAGGANPGVEAGIGVPETYKPEFIDAYELGTKNQLLGNSLQANGDIYYYNYSGLQVADIYNNTAVNQNINAKVWGAEGNLLWQATDRLQFGLNLADENSSIQSTQLVDQRNPTGGNPNTLLIKDDTVSATTGSNCVLYYTGAFPGLPAGFTAPVGGVHALAAQGIPNVAFGSCNLTNAQIIAAGYTPPNAALGQSGEGQAVSLNGNALQNAPQLSVSLSGQYVQPLPGDYSLTARLDYHWQTHMWARIFEDGADYIKSQNVLNASLQLNPPDDVWYAQLYMKNVTNQNNVTGSYLASATSGLYTNAFYGDPRTYGVELGVKF